MPHARIDLHEVHRPHLAEYSKAILAGMVRGLEMPEFDLFQSFRVHQPGELYYSRTFPGVQRDDIIFIELLAQVGYTDEQKQAGMRAIAEELEAVGVKRDDIMFDFLEVHGASWYPLGTAADVAAETVDA
jgi:hypothetical protein